MTDTRAIDVPLEKVKSHVFRKRRYRVIWRKPDHDDDGLCDPPDRKGKCIFINPELRGWQLLQMLLHEGLHASQWDLAEAAVTEMAIDLTYLLHRCGFRKVDDG